MMATLTLSALLFVAPAQVDPNVPWRSPQGQVFIQDWINLAMSRLNSSDLGKEYNDQKPWYINQYGVLNSRNIRSNYAPDLYPRYEGRLHWVWAHYNRIGPYGTWGWFLDRARPPIPSVKDYVAGRIAALPRGPTPVVPTPVQPSTQNAYAAFAYSQSTGRYGYAWGKATQAQAEQAALGALRRDGVYDGQPVGWVRNAYSALAAAGRPGAYRCAVAWGPTPELARQRALSNARSIAGARILVTVHARTGPL